MSFDCVWEKVSLVDTCTKKIKSEKVKFVDFVEKQYFLFTEEKKNCIFH